jgi:hypothetical protein
MKTKDLRWCVLDAKWTPKVANGPLWTPLGLQNPRNLAIVRSSDCTYQYSTSASPRSPHRMPAACSGFSTCAVKNQKTVPLLSYQKRSAPNEAALSIRTRLRLDSRQVQTPCIRLPVRGPRAEVETGAPRHREVQPKCVGRIQPSSTLPSRPTSGGTARSRIVALPSGGRRPPQAERGGRRMGRRVFFATRYLRSLPHGLKPSTVCPQRAGGSACPTCARTARPA